MTDPFRQAQWEHDRRQRRQHPDGWEPGVDWRGDHGAVTVGPLEQQPSGWEWALREWGLDPAEVEVVEPVQLRAWDAPLGSGETARLYYYRLSVRSRVAGDRPDVDALIRRINGHRKKPPAANGHSRALVVALSDWQVGKADGDGLEGTVDRVLDRIGMVQDRERELRRAGRPVGMLVAACLGDLVESCDSHYPMQTFGVQAHRREQARITRRLLVKALTEWAGVFPRVLVPVVGGNHGENRRDGKAFTAFGDNDDVAIPEQAAEILSANEDAYGHVGFRLPERDLTQTVDVAGTIVGLAHGHQAKRGGSTPPQKVWSWWSGQAMGQQPVGDADVLLTGHYHHLIVQQAGARTHIQAPALDGGSEWWTHQSGQDAPPGMLTLTVDADGWDDLKVL